MNDRVTNVAILGSTGSIGCNTLEVIAAAGTRFNAIALSAHRRLNQLVAQSRQTHPRWVVASDSSAASDFDWSSLPADTRQLSGPDALEEVAAADEVHVVVAAIVGSAGLRSTWAALEAGKTVALANKETLVMAGALATQLAADRGGKILPVDSEHSAIFQALQAGRRDEVKRIILTASGGPFRCHSRDELERVTVEEALAHPTWDMGPKVTIDSATMMNKALELIEARWLFDLPAEQIDIVVHPQSVIHSMVEFLDGSVIAQMSPPDMKLPIQYALSFPERWEGPASRLDLSGALQLDFEPPDEERFPALGLGREVARAGGTTGAVLNAANEAAVAGFVEGELKFTEIVPACRAVLDHHHYDPSPTLEQLLKLDTWAREEVNRWVCTQSH